MVNISCGKSNAASPEIMIDIRNHCPNIEDVMRLIKNHSVKTQDNIQNLSDVIGESNQHLTDVFGEKIENLTGKIEENFQKLTDETKGNRQKIENIEHLLQVFHNETGWYYF